MSFAIYVCPVNPEEAYDDYVSFPQFTLFFSFFPVFSRNADHLYFLISCFSPIFPVVSSSVRFQSF